MSSFTIGVRVFISYCGGPNILACANYGPDPLGLNRSLVNLNSPGGPTAVSHELGHSYGMGHVHVTAAVRPELNFLMNPALVSQQMTEPERTAIATAWEMGLREDGRETRRSRQVSCFRTPIRQRRRPPHSRRAVTRSDARSSTA